MLIANPAEEAAQLAAQAMLATRETVDFAVEEMISQPHHVLLFQDGQEDLAHLAMQGVTKNVVDLISPTNPALDTVVVLDTVEDGWSEVVPIIDVTSPEDLAVGHLHRSHSIIAFGAQFLAHRAVIPLARSATRFYAAIQDGPHARDLIEHVHPMREVVVL